jgi:carboxylate-amine ligase
MLEQPREPRRRYSPELPHWARWNPAAAERPWTVGVEEEVMLLEPDQWSTAGRIGEVLDALPSEMERHASAETHACVLELKTAPHATVGGATAELGSLRRSLSQVLRDQLGLRAAAAGTHPLATHSDISVTSSSHYRQVADTMRVLAEREPTMALHVHVAVPDGAAAVRALDGLREELPLLLALSANSPYWRARDSGFASMRIPVFSMFPRVGIPRCFGGYPEYVRVVEALLDSRAIPDPSFLWWDVRVQPKFGTVEVRIMDAQSRVADVAGLAALVQCLVCHHAERWDGNPGDPEVLAENRFLAARDGMKADLIEEGTRTRRPARDALAGLLAACAPLASTLGCADELADADRLAAQPGDQRQRRIAARRGLELLPRTLGEEFAGSQRLATA